MPTPRPLAQRRRGLRALAGALTALRLPRRKQLATRGDCPPDDGGLSPFDFPDAPEAEGGVGVREPRRPKPSGLNDAAALPAVDPEEGE